MASVRSHPRRRPAKATTPAATDSLIDSFQNMSLRKGITFHHPPSPNTELWNPLDATPAIPARSTTCPKSLEDLLIGAGERRAADLLARVDKAIATHSAFALGQILKEPEALPVFMLHHTSIDGPSKTDTRRHSHSHSSDSGLGASVADSDDLKTDQTDRITTNLETDAGLSAYATEQIHKHIVKPILREPLLNDFHALIRHVPRKIANKDINTLRDLERSLIFLAPDYSTSPRKYLHFCERTIRVLHTTVTHLHETDQRAPTDRPYTQGYFSDLIEQIRRYAAILAATRARQAAGEDLDETDYQEGETCTLQGGMTHNGRPAELVRHTKDGKSISVATGYPLSPEDLAAASMKRPMSDSFVDDDDVLRSMARRKKNAKPEIHECPQCDKDFKRPCDLTKHVKTHERPWKCTEEKCKYYEHGWPTEKERDRHVNDKHSSMPSLYNCLYPPCPYTSKRESNCKQHMEKAHGWEYVRSKSNGKTKVVSTHLPRASVPASPSSVMLTPLTPIAPSPVSWSSGSRHDSMAPPSLPGPSNYNTPAYTNPSPDFAGHFNMDFDFNNMDDSIPSAFPITPAMSEDRRSSHGSTSHSSLQLDGSSFDDAIMPDDFTITGNFSNDFALYNNMTSIQQPTPGSAASSAQSFPMTTGFAQHTSPATQLDVTFTEPDFFNDSMQLDAYGADAMPDHDFQLFGAAPPTTAGDMFPSLNDSGFGGFGGQFDQHPPLLPTGQTNAMIDELFPELRDNSAQA